MNNNNKQQMLAHAQQAAQKQMSTQQGGRISANYAAILLRFLADRSVDTDALLQQAKLQPGLLKDPNAYMDYAAYGRLVHQALSLSDADTLGLEFGKRLNISTHGLLGYAVMSSPSLAKAAELAIKYIKIRNQLISIYFDQGGDNASSVAICFEVDLTDPQLYRFEIETSLSSLYGIWMELLGNTEGLEAVHVNYPAPEYAAAYEAYFDIPVLFDQPDNRLCFSASAFSALARITDPTLTRIAEQQCTQLLESMTQSALPAVSEKVQQLLLKSPGHFLSQQAIAEQLHITPRTLARQLAKENSSYQQILDHIRQQLAIQCLETTEWSVDEIAYMLNYSDSSNFNRAFKRWQGITPKQYRSKHQI